MRRVVVRPEPAPVVVQVADKIIESLKDIIRLSGLDPAKLVGEWGVLLRG